MSRSKDALCSSSSGSRGARFGSGAALRRPMFWPRRRHVVAVLDANATSSAFARFEQRWIVHAIGCRDGDHAERVAPVDVNAILLAIIVQRLMNKFDNFTGIRLSAESI